MVGASRRKNLVTKTEALMFLALVAAEVGKQLASNDAWAVAFGARSVLCVTTSVAPTRAAKANLLTRVGRDDRRHEARMPRWSFDCTEVVRVLYCTF